MSVNKKMLRSLLREKFPREHNQLLPALHYLHHEFGYLPDWGMEIVGWHLGIPVSEVYGAATSYTEMKTEPTGKHTIRVCTGLGCIIKGGTDLSRRVSEHLEIRPGETTKDGSITFEETACGFLCALAPAVEWDGTWFGRSTPESVLQLIQLGKIP